MRALALLLILANLGFLGWSRFVDVRIDRSAVPARVGNPSVPRLVLSSEAGVPAVARDTPATAQPLDAGNASLTDAAAMTGPEGLEAGALAASDLSCVSVGAFRDLAEAVRASATLQAAGYSPRQRVEQGEVWLGYWVSVQNLATREEAEQVLADLASRGITDAYILPASDPPNTLSLGVFNDAGRAQRRVEEIRALGLNVQLADRRRAGSVYWLDVDLPSPGAVFDPSLLQEQPGAIVRLEFRNCPLPAAIEPAPDTQPDSAPESPAATP